MSPEMLVQPFEQSLNMVPLANVYYPHHQQHGYHHAFNSPATTTTASNLPEGHGGNRSTSVYFTPLGYIQQQHHQPLLIDSMEDFRATFYNPFEIKHRRRTSRAQLRVLEKSFSENPKPNATVRRLLAQQLDMTPRGVQIWFQNRRAKAKLLRRKSGGDSNSSTQSAVEDSTSQQQQQGHQQPITTTTSDALGLHTPEVKVEDDRDLYQHSNDTPNYFNDLFSKPKYWDNNNNSNACSIAAAAAASCVYDNNTNNNHSASHQHTSLKMEDWIKMPLHPLAPVINAEQQQRHTTEDFSQQQTYDISAEEWRRKSCPAIQTATTTGASWPASHIQRYQQYDLINNDHTNNRRLTADAISSHLMNDTTSSNSHMELYSSSTSSNLNYSPVSQQMTPMLSTGSPVSSVDGNYYDPCLEMLMVSSASTSSNSTATI